MAQARKSTRKTSGESPRAARGGLAKTVTPDATLAAVIGDGPRTRAEITKKIWEYVKGHDLQDPGDKRMIRADDKLRAVFGGKDKVSMFEMTRLVNEHLK